jgi:hypothetical protein
MTGNSETLGWSLSSEFFPQVPTMGSIPQVCRFFEALHDFAGVCFPWLRGHICSRQRRHGRSTIGSQGWGLRLLCTVQWCGPCARGPSVQEAGRHRRQQAAKAIRSARGKPFHSSIRIFCANLYPLTTSRPAMRDFGSATAARVRCGIDDAQNQSSLLPPVLGRPLDFVVSAAIPGSDDILFRCEPRLCSSGMIAIS